jgi:polysaccharide export outer membrane protein
MKVPAMKLFRTFAFAALLPLMVFLTGCGTTHQYADDTVNPKQPFVFPGQTPANPTVITQQPVSTDPLTSAVVAYNPPNQNAYTSTVLRPGDLIRVSFSDIPQPPVPVDIRLPDDGKITLPWNVTVIATGKTISQLQQEIRNEYVPALFVRLTINIKTEERFYYVGGEVRVPNKQVYGGDMTVLRAIDTAGGFTDFAKKTRIELRRANGEVHVINWDKARKDPKLDLKVYPNDQINVPRRIFF